MIIGRICLMAAVATLIAACGQKVEDRRSEPGGGGATQWSYDSTEQIAAADVEPTADLSWVLKLDLVAGPGLSDAAADVAVVLDSVADDSLTWTQLEHAVEAVDPDGLEHLSELADFVGNMAGTGAFNDPALLGAARGLESGAAVERTELREMLEYVSAVSRQLEVSP